MVNSYFLSLFPCVCLSLFHVLSVPISLFLFFLLLFFLVTATKAPFRLVPTTVVACVSVFLPLRLTPSLCLSSPSHPLLSLFSFPSARCNQGLAVVPVCALSLAPVSRRSDVPAQQRRARENKNYTWSSPSPSFSFLTLPFFCLPLSFLRLSRSSCLVLFASPLSLFVPPSLRVSFFSFSVSSLSLSLSRTH